MIYSIKTDERLVVKHRDGRSEVRGAGITFVMPVLQNAIIVSLKPCRVALPIIAERSTGAPFVKGECEYSVHTPEKAAFTDIQNSVRVALQHSVSAVCADDATLNHCLVKQHVLQRRLLDRANEYLVRDGIQVDSIEISDTPVAKTLAKQLAYLLTCPSQQLLSVLHSYSS